MHHLLIAAVVVVTSSLQPTSIHPTAQPANGPRSAEPTRFAVVGATIHTRPGERAPAGSVLYIDQGRIRTISVGAGPDDLRSQGWQVVDVSGLHIYPGLIEPFAEVEASGTPTTSPGRHWSELIDPQRSALDGPGLDNAARRAMRQNGFVAAAVSPKGGIVRGTAAIVSLADVPEDTSKPQPRTYASKAFTVAAFETVRGERAYPTSHMGAVALLRQVIIDARAHHDGSVVHAGSFLESFDPSGTSIWFDSAHELESLLATKISREFGFEPARTVIVGSGTELRRLDALAADGHPIVVPLRLPVTPDVSSVSAAEAVDLSDLLLWEQAPTNAKRLADAGLTVALTSSKLPEGQSFRENLQRVIKAGLPESDALAMLTTTPAALLGIDEDLGTIESGKAASFVVVDGSLFDPKAKILDVWTEGVRHFVADRQDKPFDGAWTVRTRDGFEMLIAVKGKSIELTEGEAKGKARKVSIDPPHIAFVIDDEDDGSGSYIVSGTLIADRIVGTGISPNGTAFEWVGTRADAQAEADDEEDGEQKDDEATDLPVADLGGLPFGPYAMSEQPAQQRVLVTNATIWTQSNAGTIDRGYMLVEGGRIVSVGAMGEGGSLPPGLATPATRVIDAEGRHVTPGLIDAHSHTGLFRLGVNEAGQAVTAECRIGDSLDPGNINWYRQLAGGVTTANLLHGSANPIGGQSQIVKVRWGAARPEDMFLAGAKPGIKFALGENVKQSNWGDRFTTRYPQTRMGVETLIRDRFIAAAEYAAAPARYEQQVERIRMLRLPREEQDRRIAMVAKPRRDLELEALAEILAGDRLVHCHSYRQDEILMLCRVAEEFGFTIGTFQHGLEVYKVAEAVREHAIGASLFSDWWAYKVEVQDAIPHAGPLQSRVGVLTSYNSDSDELARRMHGEAAKAIKYADGHLSPEQALAFVTINPAIQLGIADRVGSLEAGKDADFVIWSGNPLSSLSRCEATWIDGREYFSLALDEQHRQRIRSERERLIQRALEAPRKPADPENKEDHDHDHAEQGPDGFDAHGHRIGEVIERARRGTLSQTGECGCELIDHEARLINLIDQ